MSLRRVTLSTMLAAALAGTFLAGGALTANAARIIDPSTATLRQLARPTGVRIGTAVDTSALANDTTYRRLVADQFNSVTPENVMKWEVVEPQRGQYNFTEADKLVAFAKLRLNGLELLAEEELALRAVNVGARLRVDLLLDGQDFNLLVEKLVDAAQARRRVRDV